MNKTYPARAPPVTATGTNQNGAVWFTQTEMVFLVLPGWRVKM